MTAASLLLSGCTSTPRPPTNWQYKIVSAPRDHEQPSAASLDDQIDRAVAEGWEFVRLATDASGDPYAVLRRLVKR
jgi:hypothetical protein